MIISNINHRQILVIVDNIVPKYMNKLLQNNLKFAISCLKRLNMYENNRIMSHHAIHTSLYLHNDNYVLQFSTPY